MAAVAKRSRTRRVPPGSRGQAQPTKTAPKGRDRRGKARPPRKLNASGRTAVSVVLELTRDALVRACVLRLGARRADATSMAEAGDLRVEGPGTSGKSFVVDFGVLRTVSGVAVPPGSKISQIRPWSGLAFGDPLGGLERANTNIARFSEIQTQRLQIVLDAALAQDAMASGGALFLPGPPADLVLTMGDGPPLASFPGRVEPGADTELRAEGWNATGERLVDVTAAVAARLGDPLDPSPTSLEISLSAAAPGDLDLAVETLLASRLRRVDLAGQAEMVFDLEAEADREVALGFAQDAHIEGLRVRLSGEHDGQRVVDPVGPPVAADVELLADPHRSFALRLPSLAGLGSILGIRLPLQAEGADAEARVTLWQAAVSGREPETPIAGGASAPITVPASGDGEGWLSLVFSKPLEVADVGDAWAALDVVRGRVVLSLADGSAAARTANDLRRGTPRGDWRRMPAIFEAGQALAHVEPRIRVVGTEAEAGPRLPLRIGLAGAAGGVDVDPAGRTVDVAYELDEPLVVSASNPPALTFTAYSAGSTRLEQVDLVWSEPPPKIPPVAPALGAVLSTPDLTEAALRERKSS